MPTYDYECRFCAHRFEHFQGLNDRRLRKCPACGRMGLDRLIGTGAGLVFKGSGFYETDYKRAGRPQGDPGEPAGGEPGSEPSRDGGAAGQGGQGEGGKGDGAPGSSSGSRDGAAQPGDGTRGGAASKRSSAPARRGSRSRKGDKSGG